MINTGARMGDCIRVLIDLTISDLEVDRFLWSCFCSEFF